jgi:hypothetical protein
VYAFRLSMAPLDFMTEPVFKCLDDDSGDIAIVHTTILIGGRNAIEEYLACGMFPLSASFDFVGITKSPISMVTL